MDGHRTNALNEVDDLLSVAQAEIENDLGDQQDIIEAL